MKTRLWVAVALSCAAIARADTNAPPESFHGFAGFFRLTNESVEAIIVPAIGRLARLRAGGVDMFRLDTALVARAAAGEAGGDFLNYGGDWFWPVAQAQWAVIKNTATNWPPPRLFEEARWTGEVTDEGSVALTAEFGTPLNITARRTFSLARKGTRLTVQQRIEQRAATEIPVTLWNISQVDDVGRVFLPAEASPGYRVLAFQAPPEQALAECLLVDVLSARAGGEHKLGSTSPRGWIAAEKRGWLIMERASGEPAGGAFPDGGCRVTVYSNSGLGYAEIETTSEEVLLKPGQSLANTLVIELQPIASKGDGADCALADQVRNHLDGLLIAPP